MWNSRWTSHRCKHGCEWLKILILFSSWYHYLDLSVVKKVIEVPRHHLCWHLSTPPLTPQTMRQLWCTNCRKLYWRKQDPSSESWTSLPNWTGGLQEASFADDVARNSANHKYEWKLSCYFSFPTVCSLLSFALFAKEHNCVKPELTDSSVIYIKAGRWRVYYSLCW